MIGHISIAQGMLREKIATLPGFPEKLRVLVEHMILSHHGKYEFGSPKLPMTPEAILLSALDDIEAKMQAMRNEFGRDPPPERVRRGDDRLGPQHGAAAAEYKGVSRRGVVRPRTAVDFHVALHCVGPRAHPKY